MPTDKPAVVREFRTLEEVQLAYFPALHRDEAQEAHKPRKFGARLAREVLNEVMRAPQPQAASQARSKEK